MPFHRKYLVIPAAVLGLGVGSAVGGYGWFWHNKHENSAAAQIERHMKGVDYPVIHRADEVKKMAMEKLFGDDVPQAQQTFAKEAGLDQLSIAYPGVAYLQAMLDLADQAVQHYQPASDPVSLDAKKPGLTQTVSAITQTPVYKDVIKNDGLVKPLDPDWVPCNAPDFISWVPPVWLADKTLCRDHKMEYIGNVDHEEILTRNGKFGTAEAIYNRALVRAYKDENGDVQPKDDRGKIDALASIFLSDKANEEEYLRNFQAVMEVLGPYYIDAQKGSKVPQDKRTREQLTKYVAKADQDLKDLKKERKWDNMLMYGGAGLAGLSATVILYSLYRQRRLVKNAQGQLVVVKNSQAK